MTRVASQRLLRGVGAALLLVALAVAARRFGGGFETGFMRHFVWVVVGVCGGTGVGALLQASAPKS